MARHLSEEEVGPLIERLGDELYRYACSLTGETEDAADVVQTALVRFCRQVRAGRIETDTAEHYLKRSVRNGVFDRSRTRRRRPEAPLPEELPADQRDWLVADESRRIHAVLLEQVADPAVPEELREMMRLRFVEQLDAEALQRHFGRSRSAVYRLMEKAAQHLARAMRAAGIRVEDLD